ncbi:MAG TPA: PH domain-containing protein [Gemmatimonadaceae bacterium]|jgi:hypothetical protein|nr:PH domain-containing protein [Gemmatimonadaceae bacterium]
MSNTLVQPAPWDNRLKVLTAVVVTAVLGVGAMTLWTATRAASAGSSPVPALLSAALCACIIAGCMLYAPRGYALDAAALRVRRRAGELEIPLASITAVRRAQREELRGSIRAFAVGGLFGYFGRFYNSRLGRYRMYATRSSDYVLVTTNTGPVVITPAEPDQMVAAIERRLAR